MDFRKRENAYFYIKRIEKMIFLDKNSEKLTINRHFAISCTSIKLLNSFTRDELVLSDLVDSSDSSFFYVFENLDLSGLIDGEYTIQLFHEGELIEEMLGVCGDYTKQTDSYERQNNTRKVYERQ